MEYFVWEWYRTRLPLDGENSEPSVLCAIYFSIRRKYVVHVVSTSEGLVYYVVEGSR